MNIKIRSGEDALRRVHGFVIRARPAGGKSNGAGGVHVGRGGWLTAGRRLCAPRVISNVPGCRDSTLMERVALTPAFTRQARRSSGAAHSGAPLSTGANGSCRRFRVALREKSARAESQRIRTKEKRGNHVE